MMADDRRLIAFIESYPGGQALDIGESVFRAEDAV